MTLAQPSPRLTTAPSSPGIPTGTPARRRASTRMRTAVQTVPERARLGSVQATPSGLSGTVPLVHRRDLGGADRPGTAPAPRSTASRPVAASRPATAPAGLSALPLTAAPARRTADALQTAAEVADGERQREVRSLAGVVALALMEVSLGRRPRHQLAHWLDAPTLAKAGRWLDLREAAGLEESRFQDPRQPGRPAGGPPRPLGARAVEVDKGIYEASATVFHGDRARALALRVERRRDRWKVTALEIG